MEVGTREIGRAGVGEKGRAEREGRGHEKKIVVQVENGKWTLGYGRMGGPNQRPWQGAFCRTKQHMQTGIIRTYELFAGTRE